MNEPVNIYLPHNISLTVKREDKLHPLISGNKFRKLKYNILEAQQQGHDTLLTFGGAYSNHIAAAAAAGKEYGFKTIGIIRGDELAGKAAGNPTLSLAQQNGMDLHYLSREQYRDKENPGFIESLRERFGRFYLLPEGGTNPLAIKGCEEILTGDDMVFTHIACAVGTGGTISGIINSAQPHQKVIGIPVLKHEALSADIHTFVRQDNWSLAADYHFGGYAKVNEELVAFINNFFEETGIPLDPVYTGKLFFGVIDLANKGYFPRGSHVLLIHTGGLQGIEGMNKQLAKKKLPIIKT